MSGPDVLLATTNAAKSERLRWVFADLGCRLLALSDSSGPAPEEHSGSFLGNAQLKAAFWSDRFDLLVAASDGGLVIPALGDRWNALRTARAAGPEADDAGRAAYLLEVARDLVGNQRAVYWVEAIALARRGAVLWACEVEGAHAYLVDAFQPSDLHPGFWAGSLCWLPDRGKSLAALSEDELSGPDQTWGRLRQAIRDVWESRKRDFEGVA